MFFFPFFRNKYFKMQDIYFENDVEKIIKFLRDRKILISENPNCSKCGGICKLVIRTDTVEKQSWRCTKSKCQTYLSIRHNSFLDTYKIPLSKCVKLMYAWAMEHKVCDTALTLALSEDTVTKFFKNLRRIVNKSLDIDNVKLGGFAKVVEVDESMFAKVKHNRGKDLSRKQLWVFG
jgi:hypothetical protein